ncbi:MAG: hypothetical protein K2N06_10225 [Oscillospiraceae bacterium]|nr:hypothetical protein [Oscillospiraceae bacterium]
MNGNDFLNAMTNVDDKHIIEAEKKPVKRRRLFIGAMSAAAAVVIAVTAVSVTTRLSGNHTYTSNPTNGNSQAGISGAANSNANPSINTPNSIIDNPDNANNQPGTSGTGDSNANPSVSTPNSIIDDPGNENNQPRNDIVFPTAPTLPETNGELPKLTPWYYSTGGMGGPTGSVKPETDIGNPWSAEMNFETLPVYYNFSEYSEHDFMMQTLKCIAETLGYDISGMEVKDNFPTEESERAIWDRWVSYGEDEARRLIRISKTMNGQIIASIEKEIVISLNLNSRLYVNVKWYNGNCFSIPDKYKPANFTITEMNKAGRYMLETYHNMFGIGNPVLSDKSSSGSRVEYYEGGNDADEFVNYQLNRVAFEFNSNGDIISMQFRAAGMKKVGDYPIISVDEAADRLYDNWFLSMLGTVDYDFNGTEPIGAVELVYLYRREHEYIMPYYHFEVGLTAEQTGYGDNGEIRYFEYYVPAIADEYLGDWQSQPMGLPKE